MVDLSKTAMLTLTLFGFVGAASAQMTYVDATDGPDGNTLVAADPAGPVGDGVVWKVTDQNTADHIWRKRAGFGLPATNLQALVRLPAAATRPGESMIYESTGYGTAVDDVPRLRTAVRGLPSDTYHVYVYFWSDQTAWRVRAGLEDTSQPLPLHVAGQASATGDVPTPVATDEGGRRLFRVKLGQMTGDRIDVFVEDDPGSDANTRTWYDGIGFISQSAQEQQPVEEPIDVPPVRSAATPEPRGDGNSRIAHQDLLNKARAGNIDLYFLGDSITRRWGTSDPMWSENLENWNENFYGWNAGNFGWGADGLQHMLWRIRNGELDGVHPKVIVISGGTNNIGNQVRSPSYVQDMLKGFEAIIATCREKAPEAKIILTGIFPRNDNPAVWPNIQAVNRGLAEMADGQDIFYININDQLAGPDGMLHEGMTTDKLHLSVKGYQIWADALKPLLTQLMGPPADVDYAPPPTGDPSLRAAGSQ